MEARLVAAGMRAVEAAAKARVFAEVDRALDALGMHGAREDAAAGAAGARLRWFVPGRIEVLGKHTDYAGGRSLLCAAERGFCVSAVPRRDDVLRVIDVANGVEASFRVAEDQPDETRWRNYPATVARRVARNWLAAAGAPPAALRGADMAFASDLPRAAGLSSSTVLVIAVFTVLAEVNALEAHDAYRRHIPTLEALAAYLGCVENGRSFGALTGDAGVGTRGGSQDHTAILCSRAGRLLRFAYAPARAEQVVPLPPGYVFAIGASGVAAEKTGAAREQYNRASRMVSAMLALWNEATGRDDPTLFEALNGDDAAGRERRREALRQVQAILRRARHAPFTAEAMLARLDQFVLEALEIVPRATQAMAAADLDAFGRLVDESQRAAERWLGNQIPETVALAALARERGAAAASAFGAGFGGSVWALVREADASSFLDDWRRAYLARFPGHGERAAFLATGAGPGRIRL